ncbi:MAG: HEAT repeat domain-containing protein [Candidatus Latescibacterota bacterium]
MLLAALLLLSGGACGVRTVPPIRYLPLLGADRQITTAAVLASALQTPDLAVRAQAVRLLGDMGQGGKGSQEEVARALGLATKDRDPGLRLLAVEMLGRMRARYSNRYLMEALSDPNPLVREKVLQVLETREQAQSQPATPPAAPAAPPP